jgi:hypothetical protein
LVWISVAGFLGETFALTVSVWRLYRLQRVSPLLCLKPFALTGLSLGVAAVFATNSTGVDTFLAIGVCGLLILVLSVLMGVLFPTFRQVIRESFSDLLVWKTQITLKPFFVRQ